MISPEMSGWIPYHHLRRCAPINTLGLRPCFSNTKKLYAVRRYVRFVRLFKPVLAPAVCSIPLSIGRNRSSFYRPTLQLGKLHGAESDCSLWENWKKYSFAIQAFHPALTSFGTPVHPLVLYPPSYLRRNPRPPASDEILYVLCAFATAIS